jgi:hypothetical protein
LDGINYNSLKHITVLFGRGRLTQLISNLYETEEWSKDFAEVAKIALKKMSEITKCSDNRTISLIAYTAKIVARVMRRRIERKTEDALGEDQFGFRRGKGTRDVIGMLRITSERALDIDEELCACFIDW